MKRKRGERRGPKAILASLAIWQNGELGGVMETLASYRIKA